jgi:hypothetical protein
MKLTVLGIAIVGYGTFLTFTDKWKVAGVVLIAFGTLLIAVAQRRDSTADVARIEATFQQKIAEVHRDIQVAKSLPSGSQATNKLDEIDHAFSDWAASFVRNREQRKLEVEQSRVADLKNQLDDSELWRPVLELALRTISGTWKAYAAQTRANVQVRLPELPANLYDRSVNYGGEVTFGTKGHWLLELDRGVLALTGGFPSLEIRWLRSGKGAERIAEIWSADRTTDFVTVSVRSDVVPKLSGIQGWFTPKNYQTELPKAIVRLVEAQILALDSSAD